jgi:hypothetical protein
MRTYLAKIEIPESIQNESTGYIGEKIFEIWFNGNYQGEKLFKQLADRDFEKIDFADEKGYTYQVKATKAKTYTFNCDIHNAGDYLNSELYVFIQLHDKHAYIEPICKKNDVLNKLNKSFKVENSCFVYSLDLLQQKLFV